ncbi:G1/S-specific cyclin-E-like protein [Leptotrombidium deliense]|uniref:G1/S-specific cyclin-E-like protein n=1 Tax=Leptotrombidium deliense TaxID=299467 RepID=A0A443SJM9_9ACAR|nr:G1/S-specific cyclin-E-like protein [Leptotrombidium deliense]
MSIISCRVCPLPKFSWANSEEVWELMHRKDKSQARNALMLQRHPGLQPRMRSILLDWLTEVCEVYRLHRETNYLAIDFIDRYLSSQTQVPKQSLQLIGITCLFIASKIEEIYPPKLSEFAYVTDGACSDDEIIIKELVILKALNWDLYPMTINSWLSIYMQLYSVFEKENKAERRGRKRRKICKEADSSKDDYFMIPIYSSYFFAQIAHLIDLCVLDIGCLRFPYNVIATSALYHFTNEEIVNQCTSLCISDIKDCIIWMTPFAMVVREEGFEIPKFQKIADMSETIPNLQSHTADLSLLDKAHKKQVELDANNNKKVVSACPMTPVSCHDPLLNILTPPKSHSKRK